MIKRQEKSGAERAAESKARNERKCRHYCGMNDGYTCEAGVNYLDFNNGDSFGIVNHIPCWGGTNWKGFPVAAQCAKYSPYTAEEIAEQELHTQQFLARMSKIRAAIVDACRTFGGGTLPCPCCGGTVKYSRAECNGHIHAICSTPGCASWME